MIKALNLAVMLLAVTACSSLTKHKDETALNSVKKVAIIAYQADMPASPGIALDLDSGLAAEAGGSFIPKNSAEADQIYFGVAQALTKNMGWEVVPYTKLINSKAYNQSYKATMEGWQNKMPTQAGVNRFQVQNVMDFDSMRIMGPEGRAQLAKSLGVDAVVAVKVDVHLNGFTVMGLGSRKPQTKIHMQLYKDKGEKAIWFETFKGEEISQSVGTTAFINEELVAKLSVESALQAYNQIK